MPHLIAFGGHKKHNDIKNYVPDFQVQNVYYNIF